MTTAFETLIGQRVVRLIYEEGRANGLTQAEVDRMSHTCYGRYPGLLTMDEGYELLALLETAAAAHHS